MVSIVVQHTDIGTLLNALSDPSGFSPTAQYPEYLFPGRPSGLNFAYDQVRECLRQLNTDARNFGSSAWNPLGPWIGRGDRVFILPNFVMHRLPRESTETFLSKCTSGLVLRPVVDYVRMAAGATATIALGNSPIQACRFDEVVEQTGTGPLSEFLSAAGQPFEGPLDLRLVQSEWTPMGTKVAEREVSPDDAIYVDLGKDSLLEGLYRSRTHSPEFRVGDYSYERTMSYHGPGRHVYVIHRKVLESDVIVSVPKLKTHQKVGITCSLKGTVGTIARKECLAHFRRGGPQHDGDEFARHTLLRGLSSKIDDLSTGLGMSLPANGLRIAGKILNRTLRTGKHGITGGAWYGNDTAWRMSLDIARILRYARVDGTVSATPQRRHIVFLDGLMAGEGEGPLRPEARLFGAILFAPDPCAADLCSAILCGFDPTRIPIVAQSFDTQRLGLTDVSPADVEVVHNNVKCSVHELDRRLDPDRKLRAPKGWVGRI